MGARSAPTLCAATLALALSSCSAPICPGGTTAVSAASTGRTDARAIRVGDKAPLPCPDPVSSPWFGAGRAVGEVTAGVLCATGPTVGRDRFAGASVTLDSADLAAIVPLVGKLIWRRSPAGPSSCLSLDGSTRRLMLFLRDGDVIDILVDGSCRGVVASSTFGWEARDAGPVETQLRQRLDRVPTVPG